MNKLLTGLFSSLLALATASAAAQAFPARPAKVIVTVPPGVTPDITARLLASKLGAALGQPMTVENRAGAGGTIAADAVAKAPADGYTLLYAPNPVATMAPFMYSKLPYAQTDLQPISIVGKLGYVLLANKDLPASNMTELVQYLRERPGVVPYASYGIGTGTHMAMEQLQNDMQLKLLHVPYRTSPTTDLMAGQVQLMFEPYGGAALQSIASGRLKALGVTLTTRSPALPNVPAISETIPGFESPGWLAFWAPAKTPPAVLQRYQDEIARAVAHPDVQKQFTELSIQPVAIDARGMTQTIEKEAAYWSALIRRLGIKLD